IIEPPGWRFAPRVFPLRPGSSGGRCRRPSAHGADATNPRLDANPPIIQIPNSRGRLQPPRSRPQCSSTLLSELLSSSLHVDPRSEPIASACTGEGCEEDEQEHHGTYPLLAASASC